MIPHFALGPSSVQIPPPPRFTPLRGTPRDVTLKRGLGMPSKGLSAAQQNGLRYEAKAQIYLRKTLGIDYKAAPLIHFRDDSGWRTCIPDGVYIGIGGAFTIFEIKSQHCPEAWWQLRRLYQPVLSGLRYATSVAVCEVTKSFDPMMSLPEEVKQVDLAKFVERFDPAFGVLIWRPEHGH